MSRTRLAPSPTGALHLGNARTFLITYLHARQTGSHLTLRIEDIDGPRIKRGADLQALEDLAWLGLHCDSGPVYQSHTPQRYIDAATSLLHAGHAYPCVCTRAEVDAAASAPHASDGASVYPGTCRGRFQTLDDARAATGRDPCLRFRMPDRDFSFLDGFAGHTSIRGADLGDFPILKADRTPAYQLACALDDAEDGITHVLRGDDLLDSTPRQIALLQALGLGDRTPNYTHLPLVLGPDGRRLAKRHGDTRLSAYRAADPSPRRILALLARWCGIDPAVPPTTAADLIPHFDLSLLPKTPITFDPARDLP